MYKFSLFKAIDNLFSGNRKKRLDPILSMDEIASLNLLQFGDITPDIFKEEVNTNPDAPKLLLVDDEESMYFIYKNCFRKINTFSSDNVYNDFTLLPTFGRNSGLIAYRYIHELPKIDYAILDLTLSYTFKVVPSMCDKPEFLHRTVIMDGVDLAIELHKKNPNVKIRFLTSHSNDFTISTIRPYAEKFMEHFGEYIGDYYINKEQECKCKKIYEFLYGKEYVGEENV